MKRGPKPRGKVKLGWSPEFAYAIGLLTADGCLLNDRRHIDLTSKDLDQILMFQRCLALDVKPTKKKSGAGNLYHRLQFGDVLFYNFLLGIGLTPAKSRTITHVDIPDGYFADFLRGYFDGDGTSYSYYDPLFPKSYRFYISFVSASPAFLLWLQAKLQDELGIKGHFSRHRAKAAIQLKFGKKEALMLVLYMYYADNIPRLQRKYLKIQRSVRIIEATPRW